MKLVNAQQGVLSKDGLRRVTFVETLNEQQGVLSKDVLRRVFFIETLKLFHGVVFCMRSLCFLT
jgi:hypothetical protein